MPSVLALAILFAAPAMSGDALVHSTFALPLEMQAKPLTQHATKIPRKFHELEQQVQYDGEFSPPVGRKPQPEPTPTVPVHYLTPAERDLPVIVPPAPRYIDAPEEQAAANINRIQPVSAFASPNLPQSNTQYHDEEDSEPVITAPSAGSATGSNAVATYGSLPG